MPPHLGNINVKLQDNWIKTVGGDTNFSFIFFYMQDHLKKSIKNSPKIAHLANRQKKHNPYGDSPRVTSGKV